MERQNSITAELTHSVTRDIVSGELVPGSRLKLPGLSTRYGASAIPLREALSRLANQGLVVFEDNKGFSVAPVSRTDLLDLTDTRVSIECLALRQAIELGDVDWEAGIVSTAHRLSRIPTYVDEAKRHVSPAWESVHTEFHRQLVVACGSPRLLAIRDVLTDQSRRYRYLAGLYAREPRLVEKEHKTLCDAVLDRDADRACDVLAIHFRTTTQMILESDLGVLS